MDIGNLQPLKEYAPLSVIAQRRAEDLYNSDKLISHDKFWEYRKYASYCEIFGENLIQNVSNPNFTVFEAHKAFMQSEVHRGQIMTPEYNFIGIGIYKTVMVELFCYNRFI